MEHDGVGRYQQFQTRTHSHAQIHTSAALRQSPPCLTTTIDLEQGEEEGMGIKRIERERYTKVDWSRRHYRVACSRLKAKEEAWEEEKEEKEGEVVVSSNAPWQTCQGKETEQGHAVTESRGRLSTQLKLNQLFLSVTLSVICGTSRTTI